jgi:ECL1/2/3 zinc binding proteins
MWQTRTSLHRPPIDCAWREPTSFSHTTTSTAHPIMTHPLILPCCTSHARPSLAGLGWVVPVQDPSFRHPSVSLGMVPSFLFPDPPSDSQTWKPSLPLHLPISRLVDCDVLCLVINVLSIHLLLSYPVLLSPQLSDEDDTQPAASTPESVIQAQPSPSIYFNSSTPVQPRLKRKSFASSAAKNRLSNHVTTPKTPSTMSSIDFFGDFCLTCDRQTNGTTFCSQSCRLAELDRYTNSEPSSASYYPGSSSSSSGQRSSAYGFQLPPAYDFSVHRSSSATSLSTSASTSSKSASNSTSKLTEQARSDLRGYVGSFDQTRTLRRRVSMQSN